MRQTENFKLVKKYAKDIIEGKIVANSYRIKGCRRFLDDLNSKKWDFKVYDAEFVIKIIENTICH